MEYVCSHRALYLDEFSLLSIKLSLLDQPIFKLPKLTGPCIDPMSPLLPFGPYCSTYRQTTILHSSTQPQTIIPHWLPQSQTMTFSKNKAALTATRFSSRYSYIDIEVAKFLPPLYLLISTMSTGKQSQR